MDSTELVLYLILLLFGICYSGQHGHVDIENNEFAEFEDVDEGVVEDDLEELVGTSTTPKATRSSTVRVLINCIERYLVLIVIFVKFISSI